MRVEEIIGGASDLSHPSEQAGRDASSDWPALSLSLFLSRIGATGSCCVARTTYRQGAADTNVKHDAWQFSRKKGLGEERTRS